MTRQELFTWIRQQYGTEPEYPWHDWNAVLRHNDNNKWYGVVLEVSADKLGLPEAGIIDVLNVKSDPLLIGSLRGQDGYFPAYHMNKEKWLSIQLGKPELDDAIKDLLSLSHELTAPKKRNKKSSAKNPGDSAKENHGSDPNMFLPASVKYLMYVTGEIKSDDPAIVEMLKNGTMLPE